MYQAVEYIRESIINELSAASNIGIIADGWTDQSKRRFLGISLYHLQDDETFSIRFGKFAYIEKLKHTSSEMANSILNTAEQFDFENDKLEILASDSCSAMTKVAGIFNLKWIPKFVEFLEQGRKADDKVPKKFNLYAHSMYLNNQ